MIYMKKNFHFFNLKKTHYGPTDGPTDRRTDGPTDGQTLLQRWEDPSKNETEKNLTNRDFLAPFVQKSFMNEHKCSVFYGASSTWELIWAKTVIEKASIKDPNKKIYYLAMRDVPDG